MRSTFIFFFTIAACLLYWALYDYPLTGIDDAQIYFVYFRNLAEGRGFVYNYNGERVEGFTSMMWTLIGALAYSLTPKYFVLLLLVLNIFLCYGTFLLFNRCIRMLMGSAPLLPLIFFLSYILLVPGFLEWNFLSLLETGLWTFLITACMFMLLRLQTSSRGIPILSLLLALLVVTRPESMLWGAFIIVIYLIVQLVQTGNYQLKPAAILASVFAMTIISLVIFRISYFGYPLPNTYYAKVSDNIIMNVYSGLSYLNRVMQAFPFIWVFLLVSIVSLIMLTIRLWEHLLRKEHATLVLGNQLILAAASMLSFMIPLYTGGDHFGMARMLQPFIPIYFLMVFNIPFWKMITGLKTRKLSTFQTSVLIAAFVPLFYFSTGFTLHNMLHDESPIGAEFRIARTGNSDAQKLNALFSRIEKPVVGVSAAGGFAWMYKGPVFDLLGLNNVAMAHAESKNEGIKNHASFDLPTLLKVRPQVFHGYAHGSAVTSKFLETVDDSFLPLEQEEFEDKFVNDIFKGAFYEPDFSAVYKPAVVYHPDQPDLIYQSFFSVEFLAHLQQSGYYVEVLE